MDILTYLIDVKLGTCAPVDVTIRTDTDLGKGIWGVKHVLCVILSFLGRCDFGRGCWTSV